MGEKSRTKKDLDAKSFLVIAGNGKDIDFHVDYMNIMNQRKKIKQTSKGYSAIIDAIR